MEKSTYRIKAALKYIQISEGKAVIEKRINEAHCHWGLDSLLIKGSNSIQQYRKYCPCNKIVCLVC